MAWITVPPTKPDRQVAKALARHTSRGTERAAQALTWGADEHVLCLLAAGWWLYCRNRTPDLKRASTHVLATTIASSLLPHLLKRIFDQERPDRETVSGHFRGIPFSGKTYDAFPSGHAGSYGCACLGRDGASAVRAERCFGAKRGASAHARGLAGPLGQ